MQQHRWMYYMHGIYQARMCSSGWMVRGEGPHLSRAVLPDLEHGTASIERWAGQRKRCSIANVLRTSVICNI